MRRCVIVSAVPIEDFRALLREGDEIIACDAGYLNCAHYGVTPDVILGDFDSAAPPPQGASIVLPHEKDDTDTHYAAKLAVEKGHTEVLVLGGLGGKRLEHTLANISTGLWLAQKGVDVALQDATSHISYVLSGQTRTYHKGDYQYVSIFPLQGSAQGVSIVGAAYPLENACLQGDFPIGVSNEFAGESLCIRAETGALVVVQSLAD